MKKITLLIFLMNLSFGYAQSLPIDFNDPLDNNFTGQGGNVFSTDVSPTNASNPVGKIIGGTDQYNSRVDLKLGTYIDMTTANKTFTFQFYSTQAIVMNGLFQISSEASNGYPIERTFSTNGSIGWQTITLDFATATNGYPNQGLPVVYGQYAQVSIFTNFGDNGTSTYYFDDIAGAANGIVVPPDPAPTVAAPTPPVRLPADVISIYSNAYTNIAINTWSAVWDDSDYVDVLIAGNDTKKVTFTNFLGVDFSGAGNHVDATTMTHFHMDFWLPNTVNLIGKVMNPKFVEFNGGPGEASALLLTYLPTETGTWISIDAPLTDFAGSQDRNDLAQLLITSNVGLAYIDNIYLYKVIVQPPSEVPLVAAPTPPVRNSWDVISLFSNAYTNKTINSWSAANDDSSQEDVVIVGDDTKKITFGNFLGIDFSGAGNHIDASAMTRFHMDFWLPSSINLIGKVMNPKFVEFNGTAGEVSNLLLTYLPTVSGTWISIDAPFTAFGGSSQDRNDLAQLILTSNTGIAYVDNIYLYRPATLGTTKFDKSNIKMYPNPVKNTLTIEANASINKVSIYNILGQEVLVSSPKTNATTIQTSGLQKGVYVVKMDIDGAISTSKIIKE